MDPCHPYVVLIIYPGTVLEKDYWIWLYLIFEGFLPLRI
jgi:hypothetical protein